MKNTDTTNDYSASPFVIGQTVTLRAKLMEDDGDFTIGKAYLIEGLDEGQTGDCLLVTDDNGNKTCVIWEAFRA